MWALHGEVCTLLKGSLWKIGVKDTSHRILPVATGYYNYSNPHFINSGVFVCDKRGNESDHPNRIMYSTVILCKTGLAEQVKLLGEKDRDFQIKAVSNNGKWLLVTVSEPNTLTIPKIHLYSISRNYHLSLFAEIPFGRNVNTAYFDADNRAIYFNAGSEGGILLCRYDIQARRLQILSNRDEGISDFALTKGKIATVKTSYNSPAEVYVNDPGLKKVDTISVFNTAWTKYKRLSQPQRFSFRNSSGQLIDYWLIKPANYMNGKKYPLIVQIHGGPASMFGPGDASMWHEFQFFCSKGYGILYGNPRGSGGYGEQFLQSNFRDWGNGPASDVMQALDTALHSAWVYSTHLYLTGGSYGAFLGVWILSRYHGFRAASVQRGVFDLNTFFGSGNVWPMLKRYFGGYPWEKGIRKLLIDQSAITYADQLTTPLLIIHGESDYRTGVTQSDYLYKMLKVLEKPVEYVRQPNASHEVTRSGNVRQRIDQLVRTWQFFERFK